MTGQTEHLGIGVFESFLLRIGQDSRPSVIALDRHITRLQKATVALSLPQLSCEDFKRALLDKLDFSVAKQGELYRGRVIVRPGGHTASLEAWSATLNCVDGIRVALYRGERALPQYKSCSALLSHQARVEANKRGYAEALLIDRSGFVREGAWSNLFIVNKQNTLITPSDRILDGITRSLILEFAADLGIKCELREISIAEIFNAENEVFITQATNGVVGVIEIEGLKIGRGSVGEITALLRQKYEGIAPQTIG